MAVWRYLPGGTVAHALPSSDAVVAVCGVGSWSWRGDGDARQRARLAVLRDCARCEARLSSRPASP